MYMETDELLTRIHLRYFGGEKVLMLMEPAEKKKLSSSLKMALWSGSGDITFIMRKSADAGVHD